MFSTEVILVLVALAAVLMAGYAILTSWAAVRYCRSEVPSQRLSKALNRLTELECEMTELADSMDSVTRSMRKLRARIGMRATRAKKAEMVGPPDPAEDPDGYKRFMRKQLRLDLRSKAPTNGG